MSAHNSMTAYIRRLTISSTSILINTEKTASSDKAVTYIYKSLADDALGIAFLSSATLRSASLGFRLFLAVKRHAGILFYNWFVEFKRGRVNLSAEFRDGRASAVVNDKNIDAVCRMIGTDGQSQTERLGRSCLSIVPRSRSHALLRRNATMSHAFSCVQPAFIDL
ncbi:hypothetical protein EVAR_23598_1 [Eumeta japonica]|uniref:Uncharacterized protein n=1 Tax=Eumeta variegata TaxID=151549 RepID=A0A4C1X1B5_EUMVA|nr:hypothetical protein EVAR_23598_1 [Eumeta japonica]